jgi:putative Mg2+ transporter-C (MgtC) family protein
LASLGILLAIYASSRNGQFLFFRSFHAMKQHKQETRMIDIFWNELNAGFPDLEQLVRIFIRLIGAMLMGAMVGYEREKAGKPAGLRTHILVALGSTLFVIAATGNGMSQDGISRVIQGIASGIGFLGAGAILKLSSLHEIKGLTTAAGIWMTAAIGVTVGLGELGLALLATFITWVVLASLGAYEERLEQKGLAKERGD